MAHGVVGRGRGDLGCEQCRLRKRQLLGSGPEVVLGGCADPVGPVAEVHVVEIELQDLVLGVRPLEADGVLGLLDLPLEGLLVAGVEVLHELLRDGGAALDHLAGADVRHERASDRFDVDGAVVVEAVVLDGEDRPLGDFVDLTELDRDAVLVRYLGDDRTVGCDDRGAQGERGDGQRLAAFELLTQQLGGLAEPSHRREQSSRHERGCRQDHEGDEGPPDLRRRCVPVRPSMPGSRSVWVIRAGVGHWSPLSLLCQAREVSPRQDALKIVRKDYWWRAGTSIGCPPCLGKIKPAVTNTIPSCSSIRTAGRSAGQS